MLLAVCDEEGRGIRWTHLVCEADRLAAHYHEGLSVSSHGMPTALHNFLSHNSRYYFITSMISFEAMFIKNDCVDTFGP